VAAASSCAFASAQAHVRRSLPQNAHTTKMLSPRSRAAARDASTFCFRARSSVIWFPFPLRATGSSGAGVCAPARPGPLARAQVSPALAQVGDQAREQPSLAQVGDPGLVCLALWLATGGAELANERERLRVVPLSVGALGRGLTTRLATAGVGWLRGAWCPGPATGAGAGVRKVARWLVAVRGRGDLPDGTGLAVALRACAGRELAGHYWPPFAAGGPDG